MTRTGPAPRPISLQQPRRWYAYTSGPMGNAWPIYRSGPNAGDPIPGWVSFHNTNASYPAQYYRAQNEDVGLDGALQYLGFNITQAFGVKYYAGNPAFKPIDAIQVCEDSPLNTGGYFRVGVVTGLEDNVLSHNIYPNPTKGLVNIKLPVPVSNVEAISADGRALELETITEGDLVLVSLAHLTPGLYTLKLTTAHETIFRRIVKQ